MVCKEPYCGTELSLRTAFCTAWILKVMADGVASLCFSKHSFFSRCKRTLSNFGLGVNFEFPALPETECAMISSAVNNFRKRTFTLLNREVEFLIDSLYSWSSSADWEFPVPWSAELFFNFLIFHLRFPTSSSRRPSITVTFSNLLSPLLQHSWLKGKENLLNREF